MQLQLVSRYKKLTDFIDTACSMDDGDPTGDQLRRFGAVLVCGYVERSIEIIVVERLKKKAQPQVLNFVKSHFKRGTNFKCAAIRQLLTRFDEDWAKSFDDWVQNNDQRVAGIESIYYVRNSVAHGGTVGIKKASLLRYAEDAKVVVDQVLVCTSKKRR
jgi:hypothetical protein